MRIKWFSKTNNEIVLPRAGIENVATFIFRNQTAVVRACGKDAIRTLAQKITAVKANTRKKIQRQT